MAEIHRWDKTFQVQPVEAIGQMPFIEFAQIAQQGADASDLEGLAAIGNLIDACLSDEDAPRFKNAARKARASGDELLEVVKELFVAVTARPTQRPSDSSDGSSATTESSAAGSSSPVTRLERQGRPDLALLVSRAPSLVSA